MKPSSCKIRAMLSFIFECGMSTLAWRRLIALRMRVNISAMGSVILMAQRSLPARLHNARQLAPQRPFAQADAAQAKFAIDGPWTPTNLAAVVLLHLELRRLFRFGDLGYLSHDSSLRSSYQPSAISHQRGAAG